MITAAMTEQDLGRGIAIGCGMILLVLVLGFVLHQFTKPRGRGRRY